MIYLFIQVYLFTYLVNLVAIKRRLTTCRAVDVLFINNNNNKKNDCTYFTTYQVFKFIFTTILVVPIIITNRLNFDIADTSLNNHI